MCFYIATSNEFREGNEQMPQLLLTLKIILKWHYNLYLHTDLPIHWFMAAFKSPSPLRRFNNCAATVKQFSKKKFLHILITSYINFWKNK